MENLRWWVVNCWCVQTRRVVGGVVRLGGVDCECSVKVILMWFLTFFSGKADSFARFFIEHVLISLRVLLSFEIPRELCFDRIVLAFWELETCLIGVFFIFYGLTELFWLWCARQWVEQTLLIVLLISLIGPFFTRGQVD